MQLPVVVVHSTQPMGAPLASNCPHPEPTCTVTAVPWGPGSFQAPPQFGTEAEGFPPNMTKLMELALQGMAGAG